MIRQVGREAVLDEAVRRGLPGWYEEAIHEAGITTVGDPQIDLADLPEKGSPLAFSFEIGVVPPAQLGDYRGVEVGRREPAASPDEVQAELERMRESVASLETVEREAADGDFVVMDFVGRIDGEEFAGGEARGHVAELGAGRLIPGFEEQLRGASRGRASARLQVTFPEDYQAEQLAGKDAVFTVDVKEVKEKQLPELDDDFAVEAGGYDSLDELRAEIEERIKQAEERAIEGEFREAAVDAVVAGSTIEIPHELVHSKAHEMWHRTARRLAAQGVDPARYLEMTGKTEEELVVESEADAELALKREAVLAAIVEAEGIEVIGRRAERGAARRRAARRLREAAEARPEARPLPRAPTRRCARTSRCARRSTSWSRTPSRSPPSRQPPATRSGRPRRTRRARARRRARSGRPGPEGAARVRERAARR